MKREYTETTPYNFIPNKNFKPVTDRDGNILNKEEEYVFDTEHFIAKDFSKIPAFSCVICKRPYNPAHTERAEIMDWYDPYEHKSCHYTVLSAKSGYCPACVGKHRNDFYATGSLETEKTVEKEGKIFKSSSTAMLGDIVGNITLRPEPCSIYESVTVFSDGFEASNG